MINEYLQSIREPYKDEAADEWFEYFMDKAKEFERLFPCPEGVDPAEQEEYIKLIEYMENKWKEWCPESDIDIYGEINDIFGTL